jgi:hypothetical protein
VDKRRAGRFGFWWVSRVFLFSSETDAHWFSSSRDSGDLVFFWLNENSRIEVVFALLISSSSECNAKKEHTSKIERDGGVFSFFSTHTHTKKVMSLLVSRARRRQRGEC